uniref:Uncharacterized protein n=1 Tax=Arundo donax TaxID=35708 RepID=A0A0A9B4V8_ARUDO
MANGSSSIRVYLQLANMSCLSATVQSN